jgi:hypothetical protein
MMRTMETIKTMLSNGACYVRSILYREKATKINYN